MDANHYAPSSQEEHLRRVHEFQNAVLLHYQKRMQGEDLPPISLNNGNKSSMTLRTKAYKSNAYSIACGPFDQILDINLEKRTIKLEPRVTMERLVEATLPHGLCLPVIPEIKSMTVGGSYMGMAAESTSHRWGCFNDACTGIEMLCGNGKLVQASPKKNPDLFYGAAGSYGSLGALTSLEFKLIPVKKYVHLTYHRFSDPEKAVAALQALYHSSEAPDYLEGFIFNKNFAVIAAGNNRSKDSLNKDLPHLNLNRIGSKWYYQHVHQIASSNQSYEEIMHYHDYLFRHDQGAFWMGTYLLKPSFLALFIKQGILKMGDQIQSHFNSDQIDKYHNTLNPSTLGRILMYPWMSCYQLQGMLHRAEEWMQNRFVIQDFCMPESRAVPFLQEILKDPGIYPIWLCPIKGTSTPQIFAPNHSKTQFSHFINFGLYGIPRYSAPIEQITKRLEQKTRALSGRKVLYTSSYYTPDEFWKIYPLHDYKRLREASHAQGAWHEITAKVLST